MTLAREFAQFAADAAPPLNLEQPILEAITDCLGCIIAGAQSEVSQKVCHAFANITGNVPVLGTDEFTSPGHAAFKMAVAGHAYDFDDWEEPGNTHPSVVLFPALFAACVNNNVPRQRFLSAYAAGFETIARLGQALGLIHYNKGFHTTATLGAIGAAAAVSHLLRLGPERATHAICIAASQAMGYTFQFGSNTKALQAGAASRNGLEAALLAKEGCTAQPGILCEQRGMAGLLSTHDPKNIEKAKSMLGISWALEEFGIVIKPWPSCGYTHRLMTAALALRERVTALSADDGEIEVELPDFHRKVLPFDHPQERNEALFSIPSCVAQILLKGDLTLRDCDQAFWNDPEVSALASKVRIKAVPANKPEMNYDPDQPDILKLHVRGQTYRELCAYPLGAPPNPMSIKQLCHKFTSLTGLSNTHHEKLIAFDLQNNSERHFMENIL